MIPKVVVQESFIVEAKSAPTEIENTSGLSADPPCSSKDDSVISSPALAGVDVLTNPKDSPVRMNRM